MKKLLTFLIAFLIVVLVHEGAHALVAAAYGELVAFRCIHMVLRLSSKHQ